MVENHHPAHVHPVRYTVSFPAPQTHYACIEAVLPVEGAHDVEVFLPVWTPGSYLVREYARHIENVAVTDGGGSKTLPFSRSRKNRWRVKTHGSREIRFSYRVYCREMSVRTNWVEDSFALLNGAPAFVTLADGVKRPHEVLLDLPSHWQTSVTGMPEAAGGAPHHYLAEDYDTLVDSPILLGNPAIYRFDVDGIPHILANLGEEGVWDGPRSAADTEAIVRCHHRMWGSLPYTKYVFLNLLVEGGGGLEHANSVCLMASRWATRTRRSYLGWLSLVSHEYFHVWNIKRLRPVELGPFDYEKENPTKSLWISEGFTDYYAGLALRRAGLTTAGEYPGTETPPAPGSLSGIIASLQATPGRLVQSVAQASYDAWIKHYRPDENSANTSISYYTKGTVIAWLLDARIRRATDGARSLDDVMRLAFSRFSATRGFTPEEFVAVAEEIAGISLESFFHRAVETTEELDYTEALDWFGLRFKQPGPSDKAWLGAETRVDVGRLVVSRVPRETPAFDAGLNVEDEILAIDNFRVRPELILQRLENYQPGTRISILLARRERVMTIGLTLGIQPERWQLEVAPDATDTQKRHLDIWTSNL